MTSDVAIVSPREEIRLLLRGLLKLHHFRIVGEGATPSALADLTPAGRPVVLVDAEPDEDGWATALRSFRERYPDLRVVLLTSSRSPRTGSQAIAWGVSAVVHRPFAVHDLLDAIGPEPVASGPAEPAGT